MQLELNRLCFNAGDYLALPSGSAWAAFRLDALKFSSGTLNSYGAVLIAPQRCASSRRTGEIGSQANLYGENAVVNDSVTEILNQKDNRTRGTG